MKHNLLEIPKSFKKDETIKAILSIDDELSFINAPNIATEIQKHLNEFDQLNINASLAHIDLTGIQLLYSIKKSCENNQKKVNFNIKISQEQKDLILKAGFNELFES
jgi:MFS superfamily sulfate permease-like transporter